MFSVLQYFPAGADNAWRYFPEVTDRTVIHNTHGNITRPACPGLQYNLSFTWCYVIELSSNSNPFHKYHDDGGPSLLTRPRPA